jgi:hypothetical protein
MRFSQAIITQQAPPPLDRALADAAPGDEATRTLGSTVASTPPPWPADSPPDDLDQRVRQVGEWQLGDW